MLIKNINQRLLRSMRLLKFKDGYQSKWNEPIQHQKFYMLVVKKTCKVFHFIHASAIMDVLVLCHLSLESFSLLFPYTIHRKATQ